MVTPTRHDLYSLYKIKQSGTFSQIWHLLCSLVRGAHVVKKCKDPRALNAQEGWFRV